MKQNWPSIFRWVLAHEGGFVDHPADPGGATNKGVTQAVYNAYRARMNRSARSVREITDAEVEAIYRTQYWNRVQGDALPSGVDYAVYDFAVNSGVSRSVKYLQAIVGTSQDGDMGQITLAAVAARDPAEIVKALCDNRLAFLKRLRHWSTFGRGWSRRVADVRARGIEMAANGAPGEVRQEAGVDGTPKATGPEKWSATISDAARNPQVLTAVGSIIGGGATATTGDGPVQWAIAGVLAAAAIVAIIILLRRKE